MAEEENKANEDMLVDAAAAAARKSHGGYVEMAAAEAATCPEAAGNIVG